MNKRKNLIWHTQRICINVIQIGWHCLNIGQLTKKAVPVLGSCFLEQMHHGIPASAHMHHSGIGSGFKYRY